MAFAEGTKDGNDTLYAGWTSKSITLPTITKAGYTCGWTKTGTGATSITYKTGASFTSTAATTLYGVCTPNYLQTQTNIDACKNVAVGTSYTLVDSRDNNVYTVKKLADGHCWMTQNLRLGGSSTITITSSDSDVSSDFVLPASALGSWGDAANTNNTKHMYATNNESLGNYYNWYTATAGTGVGTTASASATNLTNASDSICPKGWMLPNGGKSTSKSFYQLDRTLGGSGGNRNPDTDGFLSIYLGEPYNYTYAGFYSVTNQGISYQGSRNACWSRSASTTAGKAYEFYINSSGIVAPRDVDGVGGGFTVRCVAR